MFSIFHDFCCCLHSWETLCTWYEYTSGWKRDIVDDVWSRFPKRKKKPGAAAACDTDTVLRKSIVLSSFLEEKRKRKNGIVNGAVPIGRG